MKIEFTELLRYTQEERDKWRRWFVEHPDAMDVDVQPGARFATVGALIDHIFLVERRHVQRLQEAPLDTRVAKSLRPMNSKSRAASSTRKCSGM